ncbi:MAG: hypothetical protein ABIF09_10080 [Gemmatimonadota bacterium]
MERQGAALKSSHRYDLEYSNSKLGAEAGNRSAMLLALAYLPFAFNSPVPREGISALPENHLGEAVFRAGLEGSIRHEDSKWP